MSYLRMSKAWWLEQRGNELYILGGQDAIFTLDVAKGRRSFFADLGYGRKFTADELDQDDRIILEQLLSAEVITPVMPRKKGAKLKIAILGKVPDFTFDETQFAQNSDDSADLLILVRTNETLAGFLEEYNYAEITKPHLFLDLAYAHTVSLGPLVSPGTTSCVACLKGRIESRWGDQAPPPEARGLNELADLAKSWLTVELRKIVNDQDTFLVNKTLVMDTQARTITSNKLHTVPLCSYNHNHDLVSSGKLEYTFSKR